MERAELGSDFTGEYDSLNRQHTLTDEARERGRDSYLRREETHRESVGRSVRDAMKQAKRTAGADIPNLQTHRIHEPEAQARLIRKKQQEAADGNVLALRDIPRPGQPKTHHQSVELAMETEKVRAEFNERENITSRDEEVQRFRQASETTALTQDPHFKQFPKAYELLYRELLKHPKDSFLLPQHRAMIGPVDPKTGRFDVKKVSPAGLRKLMGVLARDLPAALTRRSWT